MTLTLIPNKTWILFQEVCSTNTTLSFLIRESSINFEHVQSQFHHISPWQQVNTEQSLHFMQLTEEYKYVCADHDIYLSPPPKKNQQKKKNTGE